MKKTVILTILDGWGVGSPDRTNPIHTTQPPTLKYIESNFPSGALSASGIAVGLPWGEEGNSEMGHLTIGAGRTVYQSYPRISLAIKDESFFQNKALLKAFQHAQTNKSAVHLVGLISEANIDSSLDHLKALIKFASLPSPAGEPTPYYLHLITDGQDSAPRSTSDILTQLNVSDHIASLSGRYYAMDEDEHWDRIRHFYQVITGQNKTLLTIPQALDSAYKKNLTDQHIIPTLIGPQAHPIQNNDSVIFFNFSQDSSWEMIAPFIETNFKEFNTAPFSNLLLTTMTPYQTDLKIPVAFPIKVVPNSLSKVFSDAGKVQLKIGETSKYPQLTYFFNGLIEAPYKNEYRVLLPSDNNPNPEQNPSLKALDITARVSQSLNEGAFDFVLVNFPNGDIIGHTGDFDAGAKAVSIIDSQLKIITDLTLKTNSTLVILGSHGNFEHMIDPMTGIPDINNTTNPVPIYIVDSKYQKPRPPLSKSTIGILADVAPTILELAGVPKPPDMTGTSLLRYLL